jgi:hypothetical protein
MDATEVHFEVRWTESRGFTETGRKQHFEADAEAAARAFFDEKRRTRPDARIVRVTVEEI